MKKKTNRLLSILLVVAMVFGVMPAAAPHAHAAEAVASVAVTSGGSPLSPTTVVGNMVIYDLYANQDYTLTTTEGNTYGVLFRTHEVVTTDGDNTSTDSELNITLSNVTIRAAAPEHGLSDADVVEQYAALMFYDAPANTSSCIVNADLSGTNTVELVSAGSTGNWSAMAALGLRELNFIGSGTLDITGCAGAAQAVYGHPCENLDNPQFAMGIYGPNVTVTNTAENGDGIVVYDSLHVRNLQDHIDYETAESNASQLSVTANRYGIVTGDSVDKYQAATGRNNTAVVISGGSTAEVKAGEIGIHCKTGAVRVGNYSESMSGTILDNSTGTLTVNGLTNDAPVNYGIQTRHGLTILNANSAVTIDAYRSALRPNPDDVIKELKLTENGVNIINPTYNTFSNADVYVDAGATLTATGGMVDEQGVYAVDCGSALAFNTSGYGVLYDWSAGSLNLEPGATVTINSKYRALHACYIKLADGDESAQDSILTVKTTDVLAREADSAVSYAQHMSVYGNHSHVDIQTAANVGIIGGSYPFIIYDAPDVWVEAAKTAVTTDIRCIAENEEIVPAIVYQSDDKSNWSVLSGTETTDGARSAMKIVTTRPVMCNHSWGPWEPAEDGINHQRICSNAGCPISPQIAAHQWDSGVVTKEATCAEEGERTYTCEVCTATKIETISKKSHTWSSTYEYVDENKCKRTCTKCPAEEVVDHEWEWKTTETTHSYKCEKCGAIQSTGEHEFGTLIKGDSTYHRLPCTICTYRKYVRHNIQEVTNPATCTEPETTVKTCIDGCGYERTTTKGKALGHDWSDWKDTGNATYHYKSCSRSCGVADLYEAHTWDTGTVTTQPTETMPGVMTYTCTVESCGATRTEDILELDHTCTWGDEWRPYYGEDEELVGTSHYRECTSELCDNIQTEVHTWDTVYEYEYETKYICKCGEYRYEEKEPSGDDTHEHIWNEGVVTTAPTCEEPGVMTFSCTVLDCSETMTESIAALGHEWDKWTYDSVDSHIRLCERENCGASDYGGHEWGEWTPIDDTTHKMVCDICKGERTGEHDWDNGVETAAPTETTEGVRTYTCLTCSHTKTESIPVLGHEHIFTDWEPDGDEKHRQDCMDENCDAFNTAPHDWDNGVETVAPTENTEGVKTYTCLTCGHTKTQSIPMLEKHEHEWGAWIDAGANATADVHTRSCVVAGCDVSETENHAWSDYTAVDSNGHKKTCSVCKGERVYFHSWSPWASDNGNTHTRSCTAAGCSASETKAHTSDSWSDNSDGTHSGNCTVCNEVLTEPHDWSDWHIGTTMDTYIRSCNCCDAAETMSVPADVNQTDSNNNSAAANLANTDIELINNVLTDEEQSKVAEGALTVGIYLEVTDIPIGNISSTENALIAEAVEEMNQSGSETEIGMYLDIELFKKITVSDGTTTETETSQVTSTSDKVKITIQIPDELINTSSGVIRVYNIIRLHEDENGNIISDVIEGEFDPVNKTFTFETDKFSTYTLIYNDTRRQSGSVGGSVGPTRYSIDVNDTENGEVSVSSKNASYGTTITLTVASDEGYKVSSIVAESNGKTIEITKADGKYTFRMPSGNVTITAVFKEIGTDVGDCQKDGSCPLAKYSDMGVTAWYHDGVHFCIDNGILVGFPDGTFKPSMGTTRAMIAAMLWRMEGCPAVDAAVDYTDVKADDWYYNAVRWAKAEKVARGYGNGQFGPNDAISREQLAAMLHNYAISKGYDVSAGENTNILSYTDAFDISDWAYPAMQWACGIDMINGVAVDLIAPKDTATRVQTAAMLKHYIETYEIVLP